MTRAAEEVRLIRRVGPGLTLVSLDGTTVDGTNADLDAAFEAGFAAIGVVDGEWDSITAGLAPRFRDFALLSVLDTVLLRAAASPRSESEDGASQTYDWDALRMLRGEIRIKYGLGASTLTVGRIRRGRRYSSEMG